MRQPVHGLPTGWLELLEAITRGRYRRTPLRLNRLDLTTLDSGGKNTPSRTGPSRSDLPEDPFEQAWLLAEAFARSVETRLGRHCTPRALAHQLAGDSLPPTGVRAVIDPAVGGGALLLAAAEVRYRLTGRNDPLLLAGFDRDPLAVAVSETVLWVAAGQPAHPVGRFEVRDFLTQGLPADFSTEDTLLLANPPWGLKPEPEAWLTWKRRVAPRVSDLLGGEINLFLCFLLEAILCTPCPCGFVTPFDWLYHRSAGNLRRALAATRRLKQVFVLKKRVFQAASDMVPALTVWSGQPHASPIRIRRCGFRAEIPLPSPLPVESEVEMTPQEWQQVPFAILPLLRSQRFLHFSRSFLAGPPRMSDPEKPCSERLLHIGDGAYKTRVAPFVSPAGEGMPILTRAAQAGRYQLDTPCTRLSTSGISRLSKQESARFQADKLVLHALKKASAPWRLAAAIHLADRGPLACTNNFVVIIPVRFTGDLHYPLALLNSRLFNRMYTEHFPGVNIEAYTLGLMPLPWPPTGVHTPPPDPGDDLECWYRWSRSATAGSATVSMPVYRWLCHQARFLQETQGANRQTDERVEAVVAGLFGLEIDCLFLLLENTTARTA